MPGLWGMLMLIWGHRFDFMFPCRPLVGRTFRLFGCDGQTSCLSFLQLSLPDLQIQEKATKSVSLLSVRLTDIEEMATLAFRPCREGILGVGFDELLCSFSVSIFFAEESPKMSRIDQVFQQAAQENRMTFMPFITAGDPSVESTASLLKTLKAADVDLIELGFPYSDPIADGPVIQASYTRALDNGITVESIFQMMDDLRAESLPPVLAMVSFAIVFRYGPKQFARKAADVGFSGLIIPDLPADEAAEMSAVAKSMGLDLVQLIAPTTSPKRTQQILDASSGFVYCVSVAGTTGVRQELPAALTEQLKGLRQSTKLPLAVGFGISSPEQVDSLEGVADGIIVGSAIVKRAAGATDEALTEVKSFCESMVKATHQVKPTKIG